MIRKPLAGVRIFSGKRFISCRSSFKRLSSRLFKRASLKENLCEITIELADYGLSENQKLIGHFLTSPFSSIVSMQGKNWDEKRD